MKTLLVKFWTIVYRFKYRNVDNDVCCCGSSDCHGDYNHSYVNAKEYYIDKWVKEKMNEQ
jgi:hypothetical protein